MSKTTDLPLAQRWRTAGNAAAREGDYHLDFVRG
jgi:hypothetical protein